MKHIFRNLSIALAASMLFASCGDEKIEEPPLPSDGDYIGTFSVAQGTPMAFTIEDIVVGFAPGENEDSADIKMQKVKFAQPMPAMDITVPGVTLTGADGEYALSCGEGGIVPLIAGGEFPDRLITGIEGSASSEELSFSFVCMGLPVSFTGSAIEK